MAVQNTPVLLAQIVKIAILMAFQHTSAGITDQVQILHFSKPRRCLNQLRR
jgi:hypothetical protein